MRISEDASDVELGNEAGEAVQVAESFENGHRVSMTGFPMEEKVAFPTKYRLISATGGKSYPLENAKSLKRDQSWSQKFGCSSIFLEEEQPVAPLAEQPTNPCLVLRSRHLGKARAKNLISHYITVGSPSGAAGGRTSVMPSAVSTSRARGFEALTPLRLSPPMLKRT